MNSIRKIILILIGILFVGLNSKQTYAEDMKVHFIDVGQADATLITCDGMNMLVDGGNKSDSDKIYTYLKDNNINRLDYIICTHDDEDHVGGVPGAINYVKNNIGKVFAPYRTSEKERFKVFVEQANKFGKSVELPTIGKVYKLGTAEFTVLSSGGKDDDASVVIRIENGKHSFLLMGDATEKVENDLLKSGKTIKSTVLKVGHHGSNTSTTKDFLKMVDPDYAVISVGNKNAYGHPTEEVLKRLDSQKSCIYRTDNNGNIVICSDGEKITVDSQKKYNKTDNMIPGVTVNDREKSTKSQKYVLNTNTKKFHFPSCSSVLQMKEKNKKTLNDTRENIIASGYVPCKNCNP